LRVIVTALAPAGLFQVCTEPVVVITSTCVLFPAVPAMPIGMRVERFISEIGDYDNSAVAADTASTARAARRATAAAPASRESAGATRIAGACVIAATSAAATACGIGSASA
jgi:hypothetical protein